MSLKDSKERYVVNDKTFAEICKKTGNFTTVI